MFRADKTEFANFLWEQRARMYPPVRGSHWGSNHAPRCSRFAALTILFAKAMFSASASEMPRLAYRRGTLQKGATGRGSSGCSSQYGLIVLAVASPNFARSPGWRP